MNSSIAIINGGIIGMALGCLIILIGFAIVRIPDFLDWAWWQVDRFNRWRKHRKG